MSLRMTVGALACIVACGCGSSNPETFKATGKVTYNGQPVKSGVVQLLPEGEGNSAIGNLQPDGTFELTTFKQNDGACAGTYTATVQAMPEEGAEGDMMGLPGMELGEGTVKPPVPLKYEMASTSGLKVTINKGENELTLELKD